VTGWIADKRIAFFPVKTARPQRAGKETLHWRGGAIPSMLAGLRRSLAVFCHGNSS